MALCASDDLATAALASFAAAQDSAAAAASATAAAAAAAANSMAALTSHAVADNSLISKAVTVTLTAADAPGQKCRATLDDGTPIAFTAPPHAADGVECELIIAGVKNGTAIGLSRDNPYFGSVAAAAAPTGPPPAQHHRWPARAART